MVEHHLAIRVGAANRTHSRLTIRSQISSADALPCGEKIAWFLNPHEVVEDRNGCRFLALQC